MREGFTCVARGRFFAVIGPRDVHPRTEREASYWETPRRECIGISTPGYLCQDAEGRHTSAKSYFLRADLALEP